MSKYDTIFQIVLVLYCLTSVAFVFSPRAAITYFMSFRAVFAVVGFVGVKAFSLVQYFVPGLLLLIVPTFFAFVRKTIKFRLYLPIFLYVLFCALIVIEAPFFILKGTEPILVIQEFLKISFPFLAYLLFYLGITQKEDLSKAEGNVMIVALVPVIVGFLSVLTQIGYDLRHDVFVPLHTLIAPASTLVSRNLFGIFLALCLCHSIAFSLSMRNKKAYWILGAILVMLVIAQNRGTWIALLLAVSFSVFLFRKHLNMGKWLLGAVIVVMLASPIILHRFAQLQQVDQWGQSKNTAAGRLETSKAVFSLAMENPVIGGGPYAFQTVIHEGVGLPHNDYARVASEYGYVAMIVFTVFLLSHFLWILRNREGEMWHFQFAACIGQIYMIIISIAQNVVTDTTSYMLLFTLMAISHRAAELTDPVEKKTYKFLAGTKHKKTDAAPSKTNDTHDENPSNKKKEYKFLINKKHSGFCK